MVSCYKPVIKVILTLYLFAPNCNAIALGRKVLVGDLPYQLQLRYLNDYQCGATLIISKHDTQVVVTAGHCVTKPTGTQLLPHSELAVVAGRLKREGYHYYEQFRAVTKIIRHPDWKKTYSLWYHDVAVLHIDEPFELSRLVHPIPLPPKQYIKPVGNLIISGWGYHNIFEDEFSVDLLASSLPVMTNEVCSRVYYGAITAKVGQTQICVGRDESPTFQGACSGDDGGPATGIINSTLYLAGIFNYQHPKCGNRYQPSVFTDVTYYVNWINLMSRPDTRSFEMGEAEPKNGDDEDKIEDEDEPVTTETPESRNF